MKMAVKSHLKSEEAVRVTDAMLMTLYGVKIYKRWNEMKKKLGFYYEMEFVNWILNHIEDCEVIKEETKALKNSKQVAKDKHTVNFSEMNSANMEVDESASDNDSSLLTQEQDSDHDFSSNVDKKIGSTTIKQRKQGRVRNSEEVGYLLCQPKIGLYHPCIYDNCSAIFAGKLKLKEHVKAVHDKIKDYVCEKCEYRTSRERILRLHYLRNHGIQTKYKCGQCHSTFATCGELTLHMHRPCAASTQTNQ